MFLELLAFTLPLTILQATFPGSTQLTSRPEIFQY